MTNRKGRLWRTDTQGFILNDTSSEYIQPPYAALIADVVAAYTGKIGGDIHSIYITGSVARGLTVKGVSDLDAFAVLTPMCDPELVLQEWIAPAEQALNAKHRCVSAVQMEIWPYQYVFIDPDRFSIGGFIIKTHSVCVWGNDLSPELPEYRVSAAIANDDLVQIKPDIAEAVAAICDDTRAENVRYWCRRIMKNILRAGFGLVMVKAGTFTRDLDLCYAYFAQHYPGHANEMRRALDYALEPPGKADEVLNFLDVWGAWMINHADLWLNEYNPGRDLELKVHDEEEV